MKICVVYFSRTGNTKRMAEAIADLLKAPTFDMASAEPSAVESFDMLIVGTPVEGFRPAKETTAFLKHIPKGEGKKAILFCTYALFKGGTFRTLTKELSSKGYDVVLSVAKKGMKPDKPADFTESINEIKKAFEK